MKLQPQTIKALEIAAEINAAGEFAQAEGEFLAAIRQAKEASYLRDLIEMFGNVDDLADL